MMTILALVLLGFAMRGFTSSDSEEAGGTSQSTSTSDGDDEDSGGALPNMGEDREANTSEPTDEAAATPAEEKPTPEPEIVDDSEPVALQKCRAEVAAGDDWAGATADSAAHWRQHYQASEDYNSEKITLKRAEREFAASKAKGASDVKATKSTKKAYDKAVGGCESLTSSEVPDSFTEAAEACVARAEAIGDIIPVGTEVNSDWVAHLDMMKTKDEADPEKYYERWHMMVSMAPDNMNPYKKAAKALDKAPTCTPA